MSRSSVARCLLTCVVFAPCSSCRRPPPRPSPTPPPPMPGSAPSTPRSGTGGRRNGAGQRSARGGGRSDRFPKSRCRVATGAARLLDAGAGDARQHPVRPALARGEGERADLPDSIRALANDVRFRTYEAPFNSDTFFWTEFTPRQGFAHRRRLSRYLGRLRDVPRYFDEQIANMRAGLARGFTVPRVSVVGRDKTIEPYVKGDTTNPLYAPFAQIPRPLHRGVELAAEGDGAGQRSAGRVGCQRPLSQGRRRVATGPARVLDANAEDARQHSVRRALAGGEGQRADLPHLDPRARQRRQVPHLRGAVQQRHVLLDRLHATPGLCHRRRVPRLPGRLRDVPRYFDEQIANMRAGLARGYSVPRVSVVGRDKTIEPYVKGDTTNPLYAPFAQMPASIPPADQEAMRAEAATVIRDIVAPAYARLLTMMREEYLPKARTTLAAQARCPMAMRSTRRRSRSTRR